MRSDFERLILCLNPPLLITACLLSITRTKADSKWKKMTMQFTPNRPSQICLLSTEVKKEAGRR